MDEETRILLEGWYINTNRPTFISDDPISLPHRYSRRQDIEIAGFFAAIMSWGNRTTIIKKGSELLDRMDHSPFHFVMNAQASDLRKLQAFVHRTLNETDVLFLLDFLKRHYADHSSLEFAFFPEADTSSDAVQVGLSRFHDKVFEVSYAPKRTQKHIATPKRNSACKRLNMFLRWMVRDDENGVDFGLWKHITKGQLICPLDVHVHRVALQLGIINRRQVDWTTAVELTQTLKTLDPNDPVKYDYALFGMGVGKYLG